MTRARAAAGLLVAGVAIALLPGAATACVTTTRYDTLPKRAVAATPAPTTTTTPTTTPMPTTTPTTTTQGSAPPSEPSREVAAPRAPTTLAGHAIEDGVVIAMPGLVLACVPSKDGVLRPAAAQRKLDDTARQQGVALGELRVVRLLRDPARSIAVPPPRACREMVDAARTTAPLFVEREPECDWLVVAPGKDGVVKDAARLLEKSRAMSRRGSAPPRLVLDEDGRVVGVALPLRPRDERG